MKNMIQTNTHHAYLNNVVNISSDMEGLTIVEDISTGKRYQFEDSIDLHLSAGEHIFRDQQSNQIKVFVEDAIKIGGSKFKSEGCFISDHTPWTFVTMKDRMYIYNQENFKGRVEYNVTPDEILFTNDHDGNIFILRTEDDYTIFNVKANDILLMFSNLVYYNDHIVIYKEAESTIVYDFRLGVFVHSFNNDYSLYTNEVANKDILFFVSGSSIKAFDLNSDEENDVEHISIDGDSCKLSFTGYYGTFKGFALFENLLVTSGCVVDMTSVTHQSFSLPYHAKVIRLLNQELLSKNDFEEELDTFRKATINNLVDYPYIHHTSYYASFEKLYNENGTRYLKYRTKRYDILARYVRENAFEYHVLNLSDGEDAVMTSSDYYAAGKENTITSNETVHHAKNNENVLAYSESGESLLIERDGCLYIIKSALPDVQILSDLYDSTFCTNAFFTSDGKHVLLEKSVGVRDFFELNTYESSSFPVEGVATSRFIGANGYKPMVDGNVARGAAPVWVDPLTMRRINPSALNTRCYTSPDGLVVTMTNFKSVQFNSLSKTEISADELTDLGKRYNWFGNADEKEKKSKIKLREELVSMHLDAFSEQVSKYLRLEEKDEKKIEDTLASLVKTHGLFTEIFIERHDYVSYTKDGIEKRILIGRTAWYLNYVSYSKDSRFMAFGAKMNSDFFRCSQDGVFVIFDLKEEKEIVRMDSDQGLWAVWTTQFSQNNDVACYDGQPRTYIKMHESEKVMALDNRSFLCFSPSGNYMALSEQGYIDYSHHPNADWGHQPSTNVYVHPVNNTAPVNFLGPYSDLGEDILGTSKSTQRYNIASAAFSVDEKRLLMVGEDGVVVVRNLHLDEISIKGQHSTKEIYLPTAEEAEDATTILTF